MDASGEAELEQRSDRVEFKVEIEDVPAGDYQLLVGGIQRATISVEETPGGMEGEAEFRFPEELGDLLLDFDPRDMLVSVERDGVAVLSVDFPNMGGNDDDDDDSDGDDNGSDDDDNSDDDSDGDDSSTLEIELEFNNTGVIDEASGSIEYQANDSNTVLEIEAENLEEGNYQLIVGAMLITEFTVDDEEIELVFADPADGDRMLLDFDPFGETITIQRDGEAILTVDFPSL